MAVLQRGSMVMVCYQRGYFIYLLSKDLASIVDTQLDLHCDDDTFVKTPL